MQFQLAVIGAGPGGYVAAIRAAQRGARVCVIERDAVGGVCLNRGCIPTKALVASAEQYSRIKRASEYGLNVGEVSPDFALINQRKDEVVKKLVNGVAFLLQRNKVEVIKGTASFTAPHELSVATAEGPVAVSAEQIIIATGTVPVIPAVFGYDGRLVISSDEALNFAEIPPRIAIIGGGPIGCEFASIYRAFGAEVSVVELLPGLLPSFDGELGKSLALSFKKRGIKIFTGDKVEEVSKSETEVTLKLGSGMVLTADRVLVSIGRQTTVGELNLAAAGLGADARGRLAVGPDLRTAVPGIYAIGDVNDRPYDLAHTASSQGLAVVDSLFGPGRRYEEEAVPYAVFSDPEVAAVGLSSEAAMAKGLEVKVGKFPYRANGKAIAMSEPEGWVKLIAAADSGRLLGAHIIGAHASDLIAEAALAVSKGLTAAELAETIHTHPTLAEMVMEAAEGVLGLTINA